LKETPVSFKGIVVTILFNVIEVQANIPNNIPIFLTESPIGLIGYSPNPKGLSPKSPGCSLHLIGCAKNTIGIPIDTIGCFLELMEHSPDITGTPIVPIGCSPDLTEHSPDTIRCSLYPKEYPIHPKEYPTGTMEHPFVPIGSPTDKIELSAA